MTTRKPSIKAQMSDDELAQAMRAAAAAPPRPTAPVAMGIRYRTTGTTQPVRPDRLDWTRALAATPTESLARLDRDAKDSRPPHRRARTTAAAGAAAGCDPGAGPRSQPSAPAEASTASTGIGVAAPGVVRSWHAYACRRCGRRYNHRATDHPCGRLTPVTVTVTLRTSQADPPRSKVLGAYDAYACQTCRERFGSGDADHACGPLTPVTVTITVRPAVTSR